MDRKRSLVIDGTLDAFSKEEVFEVVGLSRQCMEVEFEGASAEDTGRVVVKAGRVLDAERPPDERGESAFVSLFQGDGTKFRVYTREAPDHSEPMGTLAEMIRTARSKTPAPGRLIMEGRFADFTFAEVLDVLGLSRSTMLIRFCREAGQPGSMLCKSGQVLAAEDGEFQGLKAFSALYADPGVSFQVYRVPEPSDLPVSLGAAHQLLEDASSAVSASESRSTVVMEGQFAETSFDELLQVISLSRQVLEVILQDQDGTVGAVVLKSGRLVDAEAGRVGKSGVEAFHWLYHHHGAEFVVVHRAEEHAEAHLGNLAELVRAMPPAASLTLVMPEEPSEPTPDYEVVVAGSLAEFRLEEVFDVVGLSRQDLTVLFSKGGSEIGWLRLKAGRILACQARQRHGVEAFQALMASPGSDFEVRRYAGQPISEPIGELAAWLSAARSAADTGRTKREIIMAGGFHEFSLAEVLEVVSLSRQLIEVSLRADGKTRGAILVKGGQVLLARTRDGDRSRQALSALLRDPGDEFVVLLAAWKKALPAPFALVREVMQELTAPAEPGPEPLSGAIPVDDWEEEEAATTVAPSPVADAATVVLPESATRFDDDLPADGDLAQLFAALRELRVQVDAMPSVSAERLDEALATIERLEGADAVGGTGGNAMLIPLLLGMQVLTLILVLVLLGSGLG